MHGLAAFVFLVGALLLIGFLLLLIQSMAAAADAPEQTAVALALTLPSLLLALGSLFVGLRLAGFASALSPRGRSLRDSDLKSVVDSHLRLWQWVFGAYLVFILVSIVAGFIVSS